MSKKSGLPAARSASSSTANDSNPAATASDGKHGPRGPKTPAPRIGFQLGEAETERVRVVGKAFSVSEKKVLQALEAEYLANAFEPHLARVVDTYEAEEDKKREERKAAIFGGGTSGYPLIRDTDVITFGPGIQDEPDPIGEASGVES